MALDAGTVNIKINAQTGDTKQRIDEVKNSLDNLGSSSKLVSAAMALGITAAADKALDFVGSAISKIGPAFVAAGRDINSTGAAAQEQLAAVGSTASELVSKIPVVGGLASGIIDAYTAIQVADMKRVDDYKTYMEGAIDAVAAYGDDVLTKAATTGLNTDTVQVFEILQGITDVDFESLETGMRSFKNAVVGAGEGDEGLLGAFQQLGVSLTNPDGSEKSMDTLLKETVTAFQSMSSTLSESEQWALATELFGPRAAQALMPLLTNGELSVDALHNLAEEVGILNDTELEISAAISDMEKLRDASKSAKDNVNGLSAAIVKLDALNAEIEANKAKREYEEAGINPETGEVYTAQDVAEARVEEGKAKRHEDLFLTNKSKQEIVFDDIEVQASGMSTEEAQEYIDEQLASIGEQNFNMLLPGEQDLREAKKVYEYYEQNKDLFDKDKTNEVLYNLLGIIETDDFYDRWTAKRVGGRDAETLDYYDNLIWDFIEGAQIASPDFIARIQEIVGNDEMPNSTSAYKSLMNKYANELFDLFTGGYSTTFYGGSIDELTAAAYPELPPAVVPEQPPITYEGDVTQDSYNVGDNSNNTTTNNTYIYNSDLSTGDMN